MKEVTNDKIRQENNRLLTDDEQLLLCALAALHLDQKLGLHPPAALVFSVTLPLQQGTKYTGAMACGRSQRPAKLTFLLVIAGHGRRHGRLHDPTRAHKNHSPEKAASQSHQ